MLCDKCKKNPAVIHIKEFINGKCKNLNLCQECAAQNGAGLLPEIGLNISELLFEHSPFAKSSNTEGAAKQNKEHKHEKSATCPGCGLTMEDMCANDHRLNCPECGKTFGKIISRTLEKVRYTGVEYGGKRPSSACENSPVVIHKQLFRLKKQLQQFIEAENYEAAAECRDKINALQAQCSMP
jgi:protein arginine kinase activator